MCTYIIILNVIDIYINISINLLRLNGCYGGDSAEISYYYIEKKLSKKYIYTRLNEKVESDIVVQRI